LIPSCPDCSVTVSRSATICILVLYETMCVLVKN
jgi:hypothetical protein